METTNVNTEEQTTSTPNTDFSAITTAELKRLSATIAPSIDSGISDMSDSSEETSSAAHFDELRSPAPFRHQYRCLDQELQDLTMGANNNTAAQDAHEEIRMGLERDTSTAATIPTATSSETGDDEIEDETRSMISLENAQVLEARSQVLTRLMPAPLRTTRPMLSPIAEASPESAPTEGSTTLVEIIHPLHQSPTSSGPDGFSPYMEDSSGSQRAVQSPCERFPLLQSGAWPRHATPVRPSPLRQVHGSTSSGLRTLNLEDHELPGPPTRPSHPFTHVNRGSIDLSSPLHVPLEEFLSPHTDTTGRLRSTEILIAANSFLSHATVEKQERFAYEMMNVFKTFGLNMELVSPSSPSSDGEPSSPEHTTNAKVTSTTAIFGQFEQASETVEEENLPPQVANGAENESEAATPIKSPDDNYNLDSTPSEAASPVERPFESLSREEILQRLDRNNKELDTMAVLLGNHTISTPISTPASVVSTPPSSSRPRRTFGARLASLN